MPHNDTQVAHTAVYVFIESKKHMTIIWQGSKSTDINTSLIQVIHIAK